MSELKFSKTVKSVPVELDGDDYKLTEMTGLERDKYLDTVRTRMKFSNDGKPSGINKFEGMQSDLLSRCLFKSGSDKPVPVSEIQGWAGSTVTALFKEAQKINGLGDGEEALENEVKNA